PGRAGLIANSLGGTMPLHLKYRSFRVLEQGAERRTCRCERGLTSVRAVLYFKARRAVPPILPPSSSGLGHLVLSQETGVRFPVGVLAGKPANAPELGRRLAGPLRWRRLQHRRARRAQLVRSHSSVAFGDFAGWDSTGASVAGSARHSWRGRIAQLPTAPSQLGRGLGRGSLDAQGTVREVA